MKPRQSDVRPLGQRSIASDFLFHASNRAGECRKDAGFKASGNKRSHLSLSEFLNQKLHRSSVLPTPVQGKDMPFLSSLCHKDLKRSADRESSSNQRGDANLNFSLEGAFEMFKHVEKDKIDNITASCRNNEIESVNADGPLLTRKRKNMSEVQGHIDKSYARKRVAVLGGDSKPGSGKWKNFSSKEEPKPHFNHYANGGGWWDCSMEGIDNEEVGCNEVWEGMGSITLGGP